MTFMGVVDVVAMGERDMPAAIGMPVLGDGVVLWMGRGGHEIPSCECE